MSTAADYVEFYARAVLSDFVLEYEWGVCDQRADFNSV